jgi:methionyl-tRNA synthetase
VGCELAKTDSELVDGRCPLHPAQEIDRRAEENYFFKFSEFQDKLLDLYNQEDNLVLPDFRFNEIKNFVKQGLQDFSISRLKEKMSWGVPVPGDDDHVMYVWFDALVNYVSAVGWPADDAKFGRFWPVVQYAGKDNLRQQTAMWQAMLMATSLPASKKIIINGFINAADGQKMSKSLGNTVSPVSLVEDFGTDALRYYIARHISDFEDHDFSLDYFKENYNAHLANGLGNLVSRIMKMASTHLEAPVILPEKSIPDDFKEALDNFRINEATNIIWEQIGVLDQKIQETTPFKLIKTDPATARVIIAELVVGLSIIGRMLEPLLPETAVVIQALVKANKMPSAPLFLRQD